MSIRRHWPITDNDVYVRVFDGILSEVDHSFFNTEDINAYKSFSPECRYLLTRTYLRVAKWIRREQFEKYMDKDTLSVTLRTLKSSKWMLEKPSFDVLVSDVASLSELQEAAKSIGIKSASSMNRTTLAKRLIELRKQQCMFSKDRSDKFSAQISESFNIECYQLSPEKRSFFFQLERMFLFPLGPDTTLETVFLTYMRKQSYLDYKYITQVEAPIFKSREDFLTFVRACEICQPIEDAMSLSREKVPPNLISDGVLQSIAEGLKHTTESNYVSAARYYGRATYNVSQLFMKSHMFSDEYAWIQKYLDQKVHTSKRGAALIRKLLLELRFLEVSGTLGESSWLVGAINTYYDALAEVSEIEMLDLKRKASKLISSIRNTGLHSALSVISTDLSSPTKLPNLPSVEIIAVPVKSAGTAAKGPGVRVSYGDGINVEQLAMLHYEDYKSGHYENSIMLTIFWLLNYDILFSDPTQFRCAFHSHPMRLQECIDAHKTEILERIKSAALDVTERRKKIVDQYNEPRPYVGSINWSIPETAVEAVVKGLGPERLSAILQRIMSNYRKYSSGFPDLTLWKVKENSDGLAYDVKFVEVKSENDTLSDNQTLWLQHLLENGIDAEICRIATEKKPIKRKRTS